jgi:uncharacterized protein (DUF427 family)
MKIPGPDHPITIEPSRQRVRAAYDQHVIADTSDAVILREANYPPVYYLPIDDVEMSFLSKTAHHTTCPYKGEASYWSIYMDGRLAENAVWGYEDPYPSVAAIKGRIAFYPDKVDVYEMDEADLERSTP